MFIRFRLRLRKATMEIPTYILFALGCLGGADIALFHSVAHGIRSHPGSAKELVTHSLRGPTYAALFLLIPNFAIQGMFAWGLLALFVIDVGISIWDFSLERDSRCFLGGLPSGEYVLHMLMAMAFGGLVATYLCYGGHGFNSPTRLVYAPAGVPIALRLALAAFAILVLLSGIQDAAAACRLLALGGGRFDLTKAARGNAGPAPERGIDYANLPQFPGWMRMVLVTAGIYNLVWGAWVVVFPAALFRWAGMQPANYPSIWQCVGMIVGVYGIGYLIAARDPFRHWPIVLVGLLGKVLGPAGMVWSVAHGDLPLRMTCICLANDIIWWLPFAVILVRVFSTDARSAGQRGETDRFR